MASIVIIANKNQPGLGRLVEELEEFGYKTECIEPKTFELERVKNLKFEGLINFTSPTNSEWVYDNNPGIVHIFRSNGEWKIYKGINQNTLIEDIFNEAVLWLPSEAKKQRALPIHFEAIELLRNRVKNNPRLAEAHYDLGMALKAKEEYDEAFDEFKTAFDCDKYHVGALNELFDLVDKKPTLSQRLEKGLLARFFGIGTDRDGQGRAMTELEKLVRPSKHPQPFIFIGEFWRESGNKEKAYKAYREAVLRSSAAGLEQALEFDDEKTLRKVAAGLRVFSSRVQHLFPGVYAIKDVVLKVYDKDVEGERAYRRARAEKQFIKSSKNYQDELCMPDGTKIRLPEDEESEVFASDADTKIITRLKRLPGKNAYSDLARLNTDDRYKLLAKLTTAAATIDHVFKKMYDNDEEFRSVISHNSSLRNFASRRIEKFFKPLEEILGIKLGEEDKKIVEQCSRWADARLYKDSPEWLISPRTDQKPHNYLLDYKGNRLSAPPESFIKQCQIIRIDLEYDELCYSIWDLIGLLEYPGAHTEDDDTLKLVFDYIITRLNKFKQVDNPKTAEELLQSEQGGAINYKKFNEYINTHAPDYGPPNPRNPSERLAPATVARNQYYGCRFLKHLELAGVKMRQEQACLDLMEEIQARIPPSLRGHIPKAEEFQDVEITGPEQLNYVYEKVKSVKQTLYNYRDFHIKRAKESLERLARAGFSELQNLYTMMEKKDYFNQALSKIGS